MKKLIYLLIIVLVPINSMIAQKDPLLDKVQHVNVDNQGVNIHTVTIGEGPLVVMVHGFPDYWYTWRHQIKSLSKQYKVVAMDLRGYNKSDKPKGGENYAMPKLVSDVAAVIRHFGEEKAIVVGHDWGGAISWNVAMHMPDIVERLIICNLPHPKGWTRELASNPKQQENSQYARNFQKEGAHLQLTAEGLAGWVKDEQAKQQYIRAFQKSDFEAMLYYYKVNYPKEPYQEIQTELPKVTCPVLMIHGLEDWALLAAGLNNTWEWLEKDLTLVTIPGAGHFVQQDAADMVSRSMLMWLNR